MYGALLIMKDEREMLGVVRRLERKRRDFKFTEVTGVLLYPAKLIV